GNIECLGRRDGQVKVNGLRIEVGEIEQHLTPSLHPSIQRGVVDRIESDDLAPGLVAFLILAPSAYSSPPPNASSLESTDPFVLPFASTSEFHQLIDDIKARLLKTLPPYMIPRYWLPVNRIPTQGMGKADRKSLKLLALSHDFSRGSTRPSEPQHEDEWHEAVRLAWSKVLRVKGEGLRDGDSFMRLGGDSIGFMKVVSLLRQAGYHHLSFRDLEEAETLDACAEALRLSSLSSSSSSPSNTAYTTPFSLLPPDALPSIFEELATEYQIAKKDIDDIYPTAPSQDAILSASVDSTLYYAQAVYALDGDLELEVVRNALVKLVERHEAMRTVFVVSGEGTLQVVLGRESEMVKRCGWAEVIRCKESVDEVIDAWLEKDRRDHEFCWGRLALSFAIVVGSDGSRKLIWSMQHSMSDGWMLELLTTDFRAICYNLPLLERPPFASVVAWHLANSNISSSKSSTFWKEYLRNSKSLGWPARSSPDKPFVTTQAAHLNWSGDLSGLVKRHGITPAIASRIAIALAISQKTGSTDFSLGIVRSGRDIDLEDADAIVGPCVSVLPSRLRLSSNASLLDLATSESQSDRQIRAHQDITLSQLFKSCGVSNRSALFDILVTFQSFAERNEEEETLARWPIKQPPERIRMPSNYALSFEITPRKEDADALELACFFDGEVVSEEEVLGVLRGAARVLDVFTVAPCTTVDSLRRDATDSPLSRQRPRTPTSKSGNNASSHRAVDGERVEDFLNRIVPIWCEVLRLKPLQLAPSDTWGSVGDRDDETVSEAEEVGSANTASAASGAAYSTKSSRVACCI
ncbi:hypothetical protein P7C70_g7444, partial [Phenoliferia sp. Uapishka_3]